MLYCVTKLKQILRYCFYLMKILVFLAYLTVNYLVVHTAV